MSCRYAIRLIAFLPENHWKIHWEIQWIVLHLESHWWHDSHVFIQFLILVNLTIHPVVILCLARLRRLTTRIDILNDHYLRWPALVSLRIFLRTLVKSSVLLPVKKLFWYHCEIEHNNQKYRYLFSLFQKWASLWFYDVVMKFCILSTCTL